MFKINKIRGHIKMLEFQELKLNRYKDEALKAPVTDSDRIKDIERALKRVTDQLTLWRGKLAEIEKLPDYPKDK